MNINNIQEDLINKSIEIYKNSKDNLEYEIRFGYYKNIEENKKKFLPGITKETFIKLIHYLNKFAEYQTVVYQKLEYYINNIKVIYNEENILDDYTNKNLNNINDVIKNMYDYVNYTDRIDKTEKKYTKGQIIIQRKQNIKTIDINQYNFRISLNSEKQYNNKILENKEPTECRKRSRITFIFFNYKYELSIIKKDGDDEVIFYDIEIELIFYKNNNMLMFPEKEYIYQTIEQVLKCVQNTYFVITNKEYNDICNSFTDLTNRKGFIGNQPITLKKELINEKEDYAITIKKDGERKLMFINNKNECYLIDSKLKIIKTNIKLVSTVPNTILDGEYINIDNIYYIFDIIYYNNQDLRDDINMTLIKRLSLIKELEFESDIFKIKNKEYLYGDKLQNLINKALVNVNYKNDDGLIIQKLNSPYSKIKEHLPLKWKPEEYNTIDFMIKINKTNKEIWEIYCTNALNENILFEVDDDNYKNINKLEITKEIKTNFIYQNLDIVEFKFNKQLKTFIPLKIRYDKIKPNYINIALDNWNTIINPIDIKNVYNTLPSTSPSPPKEVNINITPPTIKEPINTKKDNPIIKNNIEQFEFKQMRRYHNYIKRIILSKINIQNTKKILIDLGCGKGGDINKYIDSSILNVYGFDKNKESVNEAYKRFNTFTNNEAVKNRYKNYKYKFTQLDINKDYASINIEENANIIVCNFALHYFFENNKTIDNFIDIIDKNSQNTTYFIGTILCKNKLDELFDKKDDFILNNTEDELILSLKRNIKENKLKVYIKDSVLNTEEEEYIVDFDILESKLKAKNFNLVESNNFIDYYKKWNTTTNKLSNNEKMYSFLNRTFIFKKDTVYTKPKEIIPKEIIPKEIIPQKVNFTNKITVKELKDFCLKNNIIIPPKIKKQELLDLVNSK